MHVTTTPRGARLTPDAAPPEDPRGPLDWTAAALPRSFAQPEGVQANASPGRVLIVSNRLPVGLVDDDCDRDSANTATSGPRLAPSSGGLATGLQRVHGARESVWIGWVGADESLDPVARGNLDAELRARRLRPVPLPPAAFGDYYERIANGVLWPAFHDQLEHLPHVVDGWEQYEAVNERFADAVTSCYRAGDVIWIHDYHLLRLPALLRARLPDARIGFFLHIPFPSPEIFFALPRWRWLLEGMLGADVVGFHTERYRRHFLESLRRLPGTAASLEALSYKGRAVHVGVFPMGIDAAMFASRSGDREVVGEMMRLRGDRGVRLLVGIDRLDYSKGIPRRLLAIERLLTRYPQWRERIRLVQVAIPSRERVVAYQQIRQTVEHLVGRINGQFGTHRWTPIRYLYQTVTGVVLSALYRAADALLVTPLRDGMNLVAKEFVASRTDGDGVLVLSEFAGAADELTDAILVNPYDVDGMADAIHQALLLPRDERRARMSALRGRVMTHDVHAWADGFLGALAGEAAA